MTLASTQPLLAVLIDADNIPARHAEAILEEINAFGKPALRRVYGDMSTGQLKQWSEKARDLGLVEIQLSANTKGKNASDIGLVIDAMDILHTERFDGFVLVSSDSDFTRLASRIREDGRDVIGIGEAKTPESLRNACNRFILIENIVQEQPKAGTTPPPSRKKPSDALPLILRAMESMDQDDEWYHLGGVGSQIMAAVPDFDPRTYGKRKLGELIKDIKRLETRKEGQHLMVRRLD